MAFKRNTLLLVLRLAAILAVMMCIPAATYYIEPGQLLFTFAVISIVLILLVAETVVFLNRTNRELTGFLEHIRSRDFSIRFNEKDTRGRRKQLYRTFNDVLKVYRDIRIEKEVQFRFLEHIVELIEVGIMVVDRNGGVVLMNTAAGNLTGVHSPGTWEQLKKKNPGFAASVEAAGSSGRVLYESGTAGRAARLAVQVSRTAMLDEPYTLLTFQDIRSEVEQKETGAWIRLLRTLSHEIKNSVTPIGSLAETILMILRHEDGTPKSLKEISPRNLSDVTASAGILRQRTDALHEFIEEYNKLTRLPAPDPGDLDALALLKETASLFASDLEKTKTRLEIRESAAGVGIRADRGLIQQVLINLVRNSMEALHDCPRPTIILDCSRTEKGVTLSVKDNGKGIREDILDDIFMPFYSTKPGGSGIGLSLARQVMRLHGGNVRITSREGKGTTVSLDFQG